MISCQGYRVSSGTVSSRADGRLLKTWSVLTPIENFGMVRKNFLLPARTINAISYKEIVSHLDRIVKRKRLEIADCWNFHHDNASAHTTFVMTVSLS